MTHRFLLFDLRRVHFAVGFGRGCDCLSVAPLCVERTAHGIFRALGKSVGSSGSWRSRMNGSLSDRDDDVKPEGAAGTEPAASRRVTLFHDPPSLRALADVGANTTNKCQTEMVVTRRDGYPWRPAEVWRYLGPLTI